MFVVRARNNSAGPSARSRQFGARTSTFGMAPATSSFTSTRTVTRCRQTPSWRATLLPMTMNPTVSPPAPKLTRWTVSAAPGRRGRQERETQGERRGRQAGAPPPTSKR